MASRCFRAAAFEGSEDATLYRAGLAFVSSGLVPSPTQRGLILLADLTATKPTITPLALHNLLLSGSSPSGAASSAGATVRARYAGHVHRREI